MHFQAATVNVNCQPTAVNVNTAFVRTDLHLLYGMFRGHAAKNIVHVDYANKHFCPRHKFSEVLET